MNSNVKKVTETKVFNEVLVLKCASVGVKVSLGV